MITKPTRITEHSQTLIDHIYTNTDLTTPNYKHKQGILRTDISDHYPVFYLMLKPNSSKNDNENHYIAREINPTNIAQFCAAIEEIDWQWASSTGLTAVSKFKPRLPAQWAVGTHRIGPSRMEKVTSRMNWPIRNSTQIRIRVELVGNTIMWNPSLFFISNRFYKTQNNFGPWNDHIITEFSWVVTMTPAVPSTDILRWPVTSQLPSTRRLKLWRICYIS